MKLLCLDCEGPITLNDNAFEICQSFLPRGENFFTLISRYDDYLAYLIKRKNYTPGNTLKLITPFFKAYRLTNSIIRTYCKKSIRFVPGADEMVKRAKSMLNTFIISTSYTPYIEALCELLDFPRENTFSTFLDLDQYHITTMERAKLIRFYEEILYLSLTPLEKTREKREISVQDQRTIDKLDEIFFREIPAMEVGKIMKEVHPVGGEEKVKALKKALMMCSCQPENAMYVGDSITDAAVLQWVKEKGGVALAFNGNFYALREAEFACISPHSFCLSIVIDEFNNNGKRELLEMASSRAERISEKRCMIPEDCLFTRVEKDRLSFLIEESEKMRKKVRGEKIGDLG